MSSSSVPSDSRSQDKPRCFPLSTGQGNSYTHAGPDSRSPSSEGVIYPGAKHARARGRRGGSISCGSRCGHSEHEERQPHAIADTSPYLCPGRETVPGPQIRNKDSQALCRGQKQLTAEARWKQALPLLFTWIMHFSLAAPSFTDAKILQPKARAGGFSPCSSPAQCPRALGRLLHVLSAAQAESLQRCNAPYLSLLHREAKGNPLKVARSTTCSGN